MESPKHLRAVYYLISLCAAIAIAYLGGFFEKHIDVFEDAKIIKSTEIQGGGASTRVEQFSDRIKIYCKVERIEPDTYCGTTLWTSENVGYGWDITDFNSMEIGIQSEGQKSEGKLKLTLKNYNDDYSNPKDVISQKYNSVSLLLEQNDHIYSIPLSYFQVETWWTQRYNVRFENAQSDFSNIQSIEIFQSNISEAGLYEIEIFKLRVHGERFDKIHVMGSILCVLIIAVIILIDRQREQHRLLSFVDPLTKLDNRRGLRAWIDKLGCSDKRLTKIALLFMDIDDFKSINDTYGHHAGDEVLKQFCSIVNSLLSSKKGNKKRSKFCRLSGDEFGVLLPHADVEEARALGDKIIEALADDLEIFDEQVNLSVSIGVAEDILSSHDTRTLFNMADTAMYFAKREGKNQVKAYNAVLQMEQQNKTLLAQAMSKEIEKRSLKLCFMPIYDARSRMVCAIEALVSSEHKLLKNFNNQVLLSIARDAGLGATLDAWTLKSACELLENNKHLFNSQNIRLCINLLEVENPNQEFEALLLELTNCSEYWHQSLGFEITESLVGCAEQAQNTFDKIKHLGGSLCLDEFGAGATSIDTIVNYQIDSVKIDENIIANLSQYNENSILVVKAIISMASTLNIPVIANGVNNLEQFYCLQSLGCNMIQGPIFCEALNSYELSNALSSQNGFGTQSLSAKT